MHYVNFVLGQDETPSSMRQKHIKIHKPKQKIPTIDALKSVHQPFSSTSPTMHQFLMQRWCIDGSVQDCSTSISFVLAMEILQSCTEPSIPNSKHQQAPNSMHQLNSLATVSGIKTKHNKTVHYGIYARLTNNAPSLG